tara:strand:+ start:1343 stop:1708 length:366 start_codon:yes stop_codon:yes gene_type:complete
MVEHLHLIIRAEVSKPLKEEKSAEDFLTNLIDTIGMKIMYGPVSRYCELKGNRGLTAFTIIETSHVALHIWDEVDPALLQLDVYTCGSLDLDIIFNHLQVFDPIKVDYKFLDRKNGFTVIH